MAERIFWITLQVNFQLSRIFNCRLFLHIDFYVRLKYAIFEIRFDQFKQSVEWNRAFFYSPFYR